MRNPLFVVCITILMFISNYQLNGQDSKLATAVKDRKNQGQEFVDLQLFDLVTEKKQLNGKYDAQLDEYEIFNPDIETLQAILYGDMEQINVSLPTESKNSMQLELFKVSNHRRDFKVKTATGESVQYNQGAHYRGIIKGNPKSLVAFSFFEDEVMGLISSSGGNLVLGKMKGDNPKSEHILYKDNDVFQNQEWDCSASDDGPDYTMEQLQPGVHLPSADPCVGVYFEVDFDIYHNRGGVVETTNYVTGLFNQVATLYANDGIDVYISEIMVWNTPSPYQGGSSSTLLTQFQNYRSSFNGDIAQLLSFQASGGIAVLAGLCHPLNYARMSFASIGSSYNTVPTYSFTVEVVAHELGHLLGSRHTHACAWNGDNTAIDGCAGFTEGNCPSPGLPNNGGTIMSYCHITSVGINFSNGFGAQPGNVMRNFISNANCLQVCGGDTGDNNDDPEGDPSDCDQNELTFRLVVDDYGPETTWELRNSNGIVLLTGGPYEKGIGGTEFVETWCVPDACYTFEIFDTYGDGICCNYGNGAYAISDVDGNILSSGSQFTTSQASTICVPDSEAEDNCTGINFNEWSIDSYGYNQDAGSYEVLEDGMTLKIQNNAWKSIPFEYTITPNTVLVFDFGSTQQGEIHGIGFDNNEFISFTKTFKLYGTQSWGLSDFNNYPGNGEWVSYTIPIGEVYTGTYDRLFFVADQDGGANNNNSYFRNIRIYEGADCNTFVPNIDVLHDDVSNTTMQFNIYPNPTTDVINLQLNELEEGKAWIEIINATGQKVKEFTRQLNAGFHEEQIDVRHLAEGNYMLKVYTIKEDFVKQFNITRGK